MKKTININLAGYPFTVDEDAYEMLSQYLETLKHAFNDNNDDNELIEDFETRIAELLMERCPAPGIASVSDVAQIISRLGQPEEMMEQESIQVETESHGESATEIVAEEEIPTPPPFCPEPQKTKHRLYRDTDNKLLGGVCSGIAAYMGWDVVWVRLIFVALMFASFSAVVIAYFILWIVVPVATTPLQKMELHGETPTLQNIGERVVSMTTDVKESGITRAIGVIGKIILLVLAALAIPLLGAICIGLISCIIAVFSGASVLGVLLTELCGYSFPISGEPTLWALLGICALITLAVPLVLLIMSAFRSSDKPTVPSRGWRIALVTVWLLCFAGAAVCGGLLYKDMSKNYPVPGHDGFDRLIEKAEHIQIVCDSISDKADSISADTIRVPGHELSNTLHEVKEIVEIANSIKKSKY